MSEPINVMWAGTLAATIKMPSLSVPPISIDEQKQTNDKQRRRALKNKRERKRIQALQSSYHKSKSKPSSSFQKTTRAQKQLELELAKRLQLLKKEEKSLSNSVDERLLVLSKVLPAELLQGELTKTFLQRNSINVLNRIADRLLNTIRRDVFRIWIASTIEERENELQLRLGQFAQQGGIRKLKRMLNQAMHGRTERMWKQWMQSTLALRMIEQTPAAIYLQSIARRFLIQNWLYYANKSAATFQRMWRQHAARKITNALKEHQLRNRVALQIQNRWRSRCAWRDVQRIRMVQLRKKMTSMHAGSVGSDMSAVSRMGRRKSLMGGGGGEHGDGEEYVEVEMYKNSFMNELEQEAESLMALAMTGEISVEEVKKRLSNINNRLDEYKTKAASASIVIQRSWLRYVARCQVLLHIKHTKAATWIQAGYRGYCGRRYASATAAISRAVIEATRHTASFAITNSWKSYRVRQMQQAALVAITEAVKEAQRCIACMTIQDAFREQQLNRMVCY